MHAMSKLCFHRTQPFLSLTWLLILFEKKGGKREFSWYNYSRLILKLLRWMRVVVSHNRCVRNHRVLQTFLGALESVHLNLAGWTAATKRVLIS